MMRPHLKTKLIILIALGIVFALSPTINTSLNFNTGKSDESNLYNENLKTSAVSGKIHIDNNWTAAKSAGICTGDGYFYDPYVIEDLVIDGGGWGSCIWIENSNVYFRIENCTVYNAGGYYDTGYMYSSHAGIKLSNVVRSQLYNNNCSSNSIGIDLFESEDNTISGNNVNENDGGGIYFFESDDNTISGNSVNDNDGNGIHLITSDNNAITGNIANNNIDGGIHLSRSTYNTISNNTANSNEENGIYLGYDSDYNIVSGNIASNNNGYGIYLFWSDNNVISGNTLLENVECIFEERCEGNTFSDNGDCTYGEIRIDLIIILISVISGGVVIVILLRKRWVSKDEVAKFHELKEQEKLLKDGVELNDKKTSENYREQRRKQEIPKKKKSTVTISAGSCICWIVTAIILIVALIVYASTGINLLFWT